MLSLWFSIFDLLRPFSLFPFLSPVFDPPLAPFPSLLQDGTINYEIKLTGELSTNMLSPGEETPEAGTIVGPGVNAQHHQHMFCVRIDPAVDDDKGGHGLQVSEVRGSYREQCARPADTLLVETIWYALLL